MILRITSRVLGESFRILEESFGIEDTSRILGESSEILEKLVGDLGESSEIL